jgi:hypothetical protein
VKPASEYAHVYLLPRLSWSWTVLLPSDTNRKPITSIATVLPPFVTYLLTLLILRKLQLKQVKKMSCTFSDVCICPFLFEAIWQRVAWIILEKHISAFCVNSCNVWMLPLCMVSLKVSGYRDQATVDLVILEATDFKK